MTWTPGGCIPSWHPEDLRGLTWFMRSNTAVLQGINQVNPRAHIADTSHRKTRSQRDKIHLRCIIHRIPVFQGRQFHYTPDLPEYLPENRIFTLSKRMS
jgi:hypothetical protein